jgi:galactokinase
VYRYNKRVCECRIALAILAKSLKVELPEGVKFLRVLSELQEWSGLPLHVLGDLVDSFLPRQDYSSEEIEKLIAPLTLSQLLADIQLQEEVQKANKTYRLYEAAKHVFDEAYRVIHFMEICKSKLEDSDKLVLLGKLMNSSQ